MTMQVGIKRLLTAASCAGIIVAGVSIDQAVKAWALDALGKGRTIPLVPGIELRLVFNPGIAFGIGGGGPIVGAVILAIVTALLVWIGIRIVRGEGTILTVLFAVVAAGGIGNLVDRIARSENGPLSGHVVDLIAVEWFSIFNVADIFAVGGVIAVLLYMLLREMAAARVRVENGTDPSRPVRVDDD